MVFLYRSVMAWIAVLSGLSAQLAASSWPEEFVQRYEAHGLALLHTNEADWAQRANEYGLSRPTHACQIFVYRAFDLWSQAIFKSDHAHRVLPGHAALSIAAGGRQGGYYGTVSECRAEQCSEAASGSCSDAALSVD